MKEVKKWNCWRFSSPDEVTALIDEEGHVKFFFDLQSSTDILTPCDGDVFFDTKEEAYNYYDQRKKWYSDNAARIKDIIEYLIDIGNTPEFSLSDFLPPILMDIYKQRGQKNLYDLPNKVIKAMQGVINVANVCIPKTKVKYVKYDEKDIFAATLVLDGGEEVKISDYEDFVIVRSIFGTYY